MSVSKPTCLARAVCPSVALLVCALAFALPVAGAQQQSPTQQRRATSARRQQEPAPAQSPSPNATPSPAAQDEASDLSITANVTARELLFEVVPEPKVEFTGQPRRDTVWEAERTNLPPAVRPGITYRDIGIRLKITSVFADIERIVAEALGEIPLSDDTPAPANTPPPTLEPQAAPAPAASTQTPRAPDMGAPSTRASRRGSPTGRRP